jgi:hypothetical protein
VWEQLKCHYGFVWQLIFKEYRIFLKNVKNMVAAHMANSKIFDALVQAQTCCPLTSTSSPITLHYDIKQL